MYKLGQNLKNLLNKARLSENELSRRTGVPQQIINRILSGTNKNPKIATLAPIANYFMVTLSQLIGDEPLNKEIKLNKIHRGWNEIPLLDWEMLDQDQIKSQLIASKNNKKILVDLDVQSNCFAVTLKGDSMEPKFPEGTVLIFDNKKEMKHGSFGLFYIHHEGKIVFRQIFIKNNLRYTKCLNPKSKNFKPIAIEPEDKCLALLVQSKSNY